MVSQIFKDLAALMNTSEKILSETVELSRNHEILYHGSKRGYAKILEEGIKPLTSGREYGSFWAKGLSLFVPESTIEAGHVCSAFLADTPFFNYAHQLDGKGSTLLITDERALAAYGIKNRDTPREKSDCHVVINEIVPSDAIDIIKIICNSPLIPHGSGPFSDCELAAFQEYGRHKERVLLETLYRHLKDYPEKRGARITVELSHCL